MYVTAVPTHAGMARLDEFCRRDHALAVHWARAVVHNEDAIDECVQRSYVQAALNIEKYDAVRPFAPWFKTVVIRQCLGWLRSRRREVPLEDCESIPGPSIEDMINLEEYGPQECASAVWQHTKEMDELHRWLVRAIDYAGMSHAEACAILGYQPEAFSSKLHRARKAVRSKVLS